jgi:hypothetical protein
MRLARCGALFVVASPPLVWRPSRLILPDVTFVARFEA